MAKASATAPSAHRLFHKRGDLGLFAGSQLAERVLNRPHGAIVDFRLVAEAERLVSDFELPCVLEVTDHIAVLGVGGHSVPRFRRESRSCGCDQCVDLLGNGAIRLLHSGDSRKQLRFPIRLGRLGLELPDTLARRRLFFGAESLDAVSVALVRFARFCVVLVAVLVGAILCAPVRELTRTILSLLPQWLATQRFAVASSAAWGRCAPPSNELSRPGRKTHFPLPGS